MRDLSHNIKRICVFMILALTVLSGAITAVAATASPKIFITEIFPNPKGKDENKEWIELFNAENEPVNLDGWQISQTTNSGKKIEKFHIKNMEVAAKSYAVLSEKNLKKSLRNKENTLTLLNPSGETVVKIYYKSSEEEKSLSLTRIIDTTKTKYVWLWTSPSKEERNKDFYYLEEKITDVTNKSFTISTENPTSQNGFLKPRNQPKSLPGQTLPTAKSNPLINQILHKYIKKPAAASRKLTIHYQNINPLLLKIFSKQKTTLKILTTKENTKLILIKITKAESS